MQLINLYLQVIILSIMEFPFGKIIEQDWYKSNQGKEFMNCLLRKHKRRQFGNNCN